MIQSTLTDYNIATTACRRCGLADFHRAEIDCRIALARELSERAQLCTRWRDPNVIGRLRSALAEIGEPPQTGAPGISRPYARGESAQSRKLRVERQAAAMRRRNGRST